MVGFRGVAALWSTEVRGATAAVLRITFAQRSKFQSQLKLGCGVRVLQTRRAENQSGRSVQITRATIGAAPLPPSRSNYRSRCASLGKLAR